MIKLTPPASDGVYPRRRLLKELDRLCRQGGVWLAAPGGAGKTTLIASYLKQRRQRCLWYQMDAGDADLPTFFHHLALAMRRVAPRRRRPLPQLTPEYFVDVDTFARNFFRELGARLPSSTALVFDDVHDAGAAEPLHRVLRTCLDELGGLASVIFISRSDPPDALARLRMNGRLAYLDWHALKLREEESRALVRMMTRDSELRSVAHSARLHRACDGWVAGLILLLENAERGGGKTGQADAGSATPLFDYFAAEVFAHRPEAVREFLLLTAMFPAFTPAMAERLTGQPRVRALLDELVSQHHFTERHSEPQPIYQYHPLFRDFLREQALRTWGEAGRVEHLRAAASILEECDQLEHAQTLYLEANDVEAATRVILLRAPMLAAAGRTGVLDSVIAQLPEATLTREPWLQYWRGVCHLATDLMAARTCFESAFRSFRARGDAPGSYLAWAGIIDSFVFLWGDFTQVRRWIDEFEALRREFPKFPSRAVEERAIYAIFTAHVFAAPEWDSIGKWVARAERLARQGDDPSLRIMTVASLALYYPWVGQLQRFETLMQAATALARSETASPFARLNVLSMQSRSSLLYGEADVARAVAEEADAFAASSGVRVLDRAICAGLVYACAHSNDIDGAKAALEKYRGLIAPGMRLEEALWSYLASFVALLSGKLHDAEARGRHAVLLARECKVPFAIAACSLSLVRVLIQAARHDDARALLDETLPLARAIRSHLFECEGALSYALLARREGDAVACLKHLRRALSLAQRHGFKAFVAVDPRLLSELCSIALDNKLSVATVHELIRAGRLMAPSGEGALEAWPWPIRIRTLGAFELRVHDEPVRFGPKTQKKPLELLRALIALGGRDVLEEQLTEQLWPQSDGDAAHRVFDTTLHRLRKLLGSDQAVVVEGGRITLNAQLTWVDAWAFEREIARAEEADPHSLERAMSLYTGAFLGRESAAWIEPMRDRLRSMFLRTVERLGRIHEAKGRTNDALECYRRGTEADPLAEPLYCLLMLCYEQLDRPGEGLATFERLRTALSSQLGVKPSRQSRQLQERLRSAASAPSIANENGVTNQPSCTPGEADL